MPYPTTYPPEAADAAVADLAGTPCPRLTGPGEVARRLARLDEHYIRNSFVPLDRLAAARPGGAEAVRDDIAARRLPQPAYRVDDGTDYVPDDYFDLVDDAGSVDELAVAFGRRYRRAATRAGLADDDHAAAVAWDEYLTGGYLVCLRRATPENIVAKTLLITTLDRLLADPHPARPDWCRELRGAVDALRDLERPGAVLDPARWGGPMSPQWYGSYLRASYPAAFA